MSKRNSTQYKFELIRNVTDHNPGNICRHSPQRCAELKSGDMYALQYLISKPNTASAKSGWNLQHVNGSVYHDGVLVWKNRTVNGATSYDGVVKWFIKHRNIDIVPVRKNTHVVWDYDSDYENPVQREV